MPCTVDRTCTHARVTHMMCPCSGMGCTRARVQSPVRSSHTPGSHWYEGRTCQPNSSYPAADPAYRERCGPLRGCPWPGTACYVGDPCMVWQAGRYNWSLLARPTADLLAFLLIAMIAVQQCDSMLCDVPIYVMRCPYCIMSYVIMCHVFWFLKYAIISCHTQRCGTVL